MADYTDSKSGEAVFPHYSVASNEWDRLEPLITSQELRDGFLFGIPLVSNIVDPITGTRAVMTVEQLEKIIVRAVSIAEQELKIDIFPVQREMKTPFDRFQYESFLYLQLPHRPITSVEKWEVVPSDQSVIYSIPLDWVETHNGLAQGQLNVIPLTAALLGSGGWTTTAGTFSSAGGAFFLAILGMRSWIPAFWRVTYTSGFTGGLLPRDINEYIGIIAAMEILSMLASTYAPVSSHSISYDGMSQSISTPSSQIFTVRLGELKEKRETAKQLLRSYFTTKYVMGVI